jgi:hypothetical protein
MRTLRLGMSGEDVTTWKLFLRGIDPSCTLDTDDDNFDSDTQRFTKVFQVRVNVPSDGVVGSSTYGKALSLGLNSITDDSSDETSQSWPSCPADIKPLSSAERESLFGKFSYVSAPTSSDPEAIKITDNWASSNIILATVPQLKHIASPGKISVHKLASEQILGFFQAIEDNGMLSQLRTWGGCYNPRFARGSKQYLSNHAWGTAFDINVQWNMLGTIPALKNQVGSVREIATIATQFGLYWGGWFPNRPDGMHFEVYSLF